MDGIEFVLCGGCSIYFFFYEVINILRVFEFVFLGERILFFFKDEKNVFRIVF